MKLTFITNFVNHHQIPLADELYKLWGEDYTYIATSPLGNSFIQNGYPIYKRPYILNAYESAENQDKAVHLCLESDIVIIGAVSDTYIKDRLSQNKLTFRYSERWFKNGYWGLLSPRAWFYCFKKHIQYRSKNLYMLCASAYMPNDAAIIHAYPSKCYKWGYFTQVPTFDICASLKHRRSSQLRILWVSRFIDWKHPELMPMLAYLLKKRNIDFTIGMVGAGDKLQSVKSLANKLHVDEKINFLGQMPNEQVMTLMRTYHIFCFTSDRHEGWGAVLNEAMSNGCCVIGSHEIGSVPFLIKDKETGLIFQSKSLNSLFEKVMYLYEHPQERENMAINAYQFLSKVWSPNNVAKNLQSLINSIQNNHPITIPNDAPCSIALPCKNIFQK